MPAPRIRFENNDKAAHAVSHYLDNLRPSPQRFALRPYNRFLPDFTEWWLIPQSDWPAYRYSKLFFHRFQPSATEPKWFYTGFYVERGLGKQLAGMAEVNIRHIMQDDWYWYDFVRHTKSDEMDSAVREVLLRSQQPVVVSIDAYEFNRVPEPDTDRQLPHDDPKNVRVLARLGAIALWNNRVEKAEHYLKNATDCAPGPLKLAFQCPTQDVAGYDVLSDR